MPSQQMSNPPPPNDEAISFHLLILVFNENHNYLNTRKVFRAAEGNFFFFLIFLVFVWVELELQVTMVLTMSLL